MGGLDGIFRRYLSEVTGEPALLADPLLARCVLDALLTQENTKRAATLSDLTKARFRAGTQEIEPFLRVFVRRYIVRRSLRNGVEWFELIHERLVPFVQEWLDQDADFVNFWIARDLITYTSRGEYWRKQSNLLLNAGQIEGVIKPFRGRLELMRHGIGVRLPERSGQRVRRCGLLGRSFRSREECGNGARGLAGSRPHPPPGSGQNRWDDDRSDRSHPGGVRPFRQRERSGHSPGGGPILYAAPRARWSFSTGQTRTSSRRARAFPSRCPELREVSAGFPGPGQPTQAASGRPPHRWPGASSDKDPESTAGLLHPCLRSYSGSNNLLDVFATGFCR